MITIKDNQFQVRTTHYYSAETIVRYYQNIRYQLKIFPLMLINVKFHLKLQVLVRRSESLFRIYQSVFSWC
jgi:hypothetical protein